MVIVIRDLMVGIFKHLNITSWDMFDHIWMSFEKSLKEYALNKFRSSVLSCREIVEADFRDYWNLGNPKYVKP